MKKKEEQDYYTARHLLEALQALDEASLNCPLVLIHGKQLTKANLVSGLIPSAVTVDQTVVMEKKPSLMALGDLR